MTIGPTLVIACPICNCELLHSTVSSTNNFGAIFYSDGKMVAPMSPEIIKLTRCENCNSFFWIKDAEVLRKIKPYSFEALFSDEPIREPDYKSTRHLSAEELLEALDILELDEDQECSLRIWAWQKENDTNRALSLDQRATTKSSQSEKNLNALLQLLHQSDIETQIMKAEVLRQLGHFEEARKILSIQTGSSIQYTVDQIRFACEQHDSRLIKLIPRWQKPNS